jgi:hypothetical protein
MKALIPFSLILFSLACCKKEVKTVPVLAPAVSVSVKTDTIPDKAAFKLQLAKDSINTDETLFIFSHRYRLGSFSGEDAVYFAGNGQVSLASISKDGQNLCINGLPYTPWMAVGLDIHAKTSGSYLLKISYEKEIPADIEIWVKDTYLRDSLNVRTGNYRFNIDKADTNSFGAERLSLILKAADQQAAIGH